MTNSEMLEPSFPTKLRTEFAFLLRPQHYPDFLDIFPLGAIRDQRKLHCKSVGKSPKARNP
jgi:hypothetical protein